LRERSCWGFSGLSRRLAVALALLGALAVSGAAASAAGATGTLTVSVQGPGRVTAPGIDCSDGGGACSRFYVSERICEQPPEGGKPICYLQHPFVIASAQPRPGAGYAFLRWDGCPPSQNDGGPTCRLSMTQNYNLTVHFIDDTAPSVAVLEPARDVARAQVRLRASTFDNVGVTQVEYYVRGVRVGSVGPSEGVTFDTTQVGDGPAVVKAVASDAAGRSGQGERTVIFDNTPPALAVAGAGEAQFAPGTAVRWTISAADAVGLAGVQCSLQPKGSPASFGPCSGGKASHAATVRAVGAYAFAVRATDTAGNVTTSLPMEFRIDPRAAGPGTATAVGSDSDAGGLGVFQPLVRYSFLTRGAWTRFLRLSVSGLPPGSRAALACDGRGCPVKRVRFTPRSGRVSFVGALKRRRLRAGARLSVTIRGPAGERKVVAFRMRRGKAPRKSVRCALPQGRLSRCR
jgi:hypothetical protein